MQSLKCRCRKTELSQGARCPFCKSGPVGLTVDLSTVRRPDNIDAILQGIAPSLPPVGVR